MVFNLKAVICCIIAVVVLFGLQGCGYGSGNNIEWKLSDIDESQLNTNADVSMRTENTSYPPGVKSLNVVISNNTNDTLDYGAAYLIERMQSGEWYSANMEDIAWIMIAYILSPGETQTHEINFEVLEETLQQGQYRIIKSIGGNLYSAEFSVAAGG